MKDHTYTYVTGTAIFLLVLGQIMPKWAVFLATVSLCYGTIVLGMILLVRTGLVSFGHGLYYCLGAYAAGTLRPLWGNSELLVMLAASIFLTATVAFILGFLLRKYRDIFFAMLSLAFSMILYGLLSKSAALGSTDGFNVYVDTVLGIPMTNFEDPRYVIFGITILGSWISCILMHRYLKSDKGKLAEAIRDNELRVEYLGANVANIIHFNYVISAVLAGIGGALMAISIGHIDPEMSYWTTSGEFVFITILAGSGSVIAPFLGAFIFETIRSFAYEYSPNTWQMLLGITMLLVIVFLPNGLWSLFAKIHNKLNK